MDTQIPITWPDGGGVLWQLNHGGIPRFRCHTGHAFTLGVLHKASQEPLETTLWVALRKLEERQHLLTHLPPVLTLKQQPYRSRSPLTR